MNRSATRSVTVGSRMAYFLRSSAQRLFSVSANSPVRSASARRQVSAAALRPRRTSTEWAISTGFKCQATRS